MFVHSSKDTHVTMPLLHSACLQYHTIFTLMKKSTHRQKHTYTSTLTKRKGHIPACFRYGGRLHIPQVLFRISFGRARRYKQCVLVLSRMVRDSSVSLHLHCRARMYGGAQAGFRPSFLLGDICEAYQYRK